MHTSLKLQVASCRCQTYARKPCANSDVLRGSVQHHTTGCHWAWSALRSPQIRGLNINVFSSFRMPSKTNCTSGQSICNNNNQWENQSGGPDWWPHFRHQRSLRSKERRSKRGERGEERSRNISCNVRCFWHDVSVSQQNIWNRTDVMKGRRFLQTTAPRNLDPAWPWWSPTHTFFPRVNVSADNKCSCYQPAELSECITECKSV